MVHSGSTIVVPWYFMHGVQSEQVCESASVRDVIVSHEDLRLKTRDRRDATRTQRIICDQLEFWYSQFCVLVLALVLMVTAQQRVSARLTHRASRRYRETLVMMMKMKRRRRRRISHEEDDADADELREEDR